MAADKKEAASKQEALENALKKIEKDFGKGSIMRLGDAKAHMDIEVIPTGILPLDIALGVGGIAVSLGLKDTVANVISGFGLMLGKVIQPGDLVSVAGATGVVKDITWRQTVVRERNGNEMVIPNSVLNTASLEKLTPSNEGCVTMTFTAKAGSDPAHVTEAVKRAVATATVEFAQPGSEPLVKLTGFSPYGIEVQALAFTRDGVFLSTMRDAMARAIAGCEFVEQRAAVGE